MSGAIKRTAEGDSNLLGVLLNLEDFWQPIEARGTTDPNYLVIRSVVNASASGMLTLAEVYEDEAAAAYARDLTERTKRVSGLSGVAR